MMDLWEKERRRLAKLGRRPPPRPTPPFVPVYPLITRPLLMRRNLAPQTARSHPYQIHAVSRTEVPPQGFEKAGWFTCCGWHDFYQTFGWGFKPTLKQPDEA